MLHMLGLEICADTVVGNQMLRGISGGQKKRVTSGEALVGHAKVRRGFRFLPPPPLLLCLALLLLLILVLLPLLPLSLLLRYYSQTKIFVSPLQTGAVRGRDLHRPRLQHHPPDHQVAAQLLPRHEREQSGTRANKGMAGVGWCAPADGMCWLSSARAVAPCGATGRTPALPTCQLTITQVAPPVHVPLPQGTMLVALLQPSPETFELFDDVMLLASGMVSFRAHAYLCSPADGAVEAGAGVITLLSCLHSHLLHPHPPTHPPTIPSFTGAVPRPARGRDALLPRPPRL